MRVNEYSSLTVTANFTFGGGVAIPATAHFRLLDVDSNKVLQDWTAGTITTVTDDFGATTECSSTFVISGQLNGMRGGRDKEQKALCISTDKGMASEHNDELIYTVYRLKARS